MQLKKFFSLSAKPYRWNSSRLIFLWLFYPFSSLSSYIQVSQLLHTGYYDFHGHLTGDNSLETGDNRFLYGFMAHNPSPARIEPLPVFLYLSKLLSIDRELTRWQFDTPPLTRHVLFLPSGASSAFRTYRFSVHTRPLNWRNGSERARGGHLSYIYHVCGIKLRAIIRGVRRVSRGQSGREIGSWGL